jgi:hypothetical protein
MRMIEFTKGYEEHDQLNPKLWDDNQLRPEVKIKLLQIADKFREFIDLDIPVLDIHITGGQVTYHYTDQSDLDLHLIVDYSKIQCDQEVEELLDTKRLLFKEKFQINIRGIPVEPGTEDINRPTVSSAWSLKTDSWIREPKNYSGKIDHENVKTQYKYWDKLIGSVLEQNDLKSAQKVLKLLRKYRKSGLKHSGEYGVENLVYKSLRNSRVLAKLVNFIDSGDTRDLSI